MDDVADNALLRPLNYYFTGPSLAAHCPTRFILRLIETLHVTAVVTTENESRIVITYFLCV
jgi:hypothetical protein